ncbi:MAG TPA: hypothetical protein VIL48_08825 [Acidimicrobiales bacterium]
MALGAAALLGAASLAGALAPPRRRAWAQAATVAELTVATFAVDAVGGADLQIDSLLGYNPLVAGRIIGFGNIAFAVLGAAAVVLAALLAECRDRRTGVLAVAGVAVPVLALDGWPAWGADFGGVLALVPAFAVLGMLVARKRLTWRRLVTAGGAGTLVVTAVSWLDYLRPAAERTHFGRFDEAVLDGRALDTIGRKLANSLESLFMGPPHARRPGRRRRPGRGRAPPAGAAAAGVHCPAGAAADAAGQPHVGGLRVRPQRLGRGRTGRDGPGDRAAHARPVRRCGRPERVGRRVPVAGARPRVRA